MINHMIKNMRSFLASALLAALLSCGGRPGTGSGNTANQDTLGVATNNLVLDHFKDLPDEIEGCSCYFSETEERFKNKEYLFTSDMDSTAFISIDNKLVRLKMVSSTQEPNTAGGKDYSEVYSNGTLKVKVDVKYKNANGDETWWNDGTITVESTDGRRTSRKFVGECGC